MNTAGDATSEEEKMWQETLVEKISAAQKDSQLWGEVEDILEARISDKKGEGGVCEGKVNVTPLYSRMKAAAQVWGCPYFEEDDVSLDNVGVRAPNKLDSFLHNLQRIAWVYEKQVLKPHGDDDEKSERPRIPKENSKVFKNAAKRGFETPPLVDAWSCFECKSSIFLLFHQLSMWSGEELQRTELGIAVYKHLAYLFSQMMLALNVGESTLSHDRGCGHWNLTPDELVSNYHTILLAGGVQKDGDLIRFFDMPLIIDPPDSDSDKEEDEERISPCRCTNDGTICLWCMEAAAKVASSMTDTHVEILPHAKVRIHLDPYKLEDMQPEDDTEVFCHDYIW